MMREQDLRAASTFFDCNNKYNTWRNPRDKRPHQIDHFLIPRNQLCYTTNVKQKLDSIDSDHAALCIKFQLPDGALLSNRRNPKKDVEPCPKYKINNFVLRNSQKRNFQENASNFLQNMPPQLIASSSDDELILLFEKHIVKAAKEVAEQPITTKPDWFSTSEQDLMELISIRNDALKNHMKRGTSETQELLKKARRNLLRAKRKAKRNWQLEFAKKCQQKSFKANPKEAWRMVSCLMDGVQKHHRNLAPKSFKNREGKIAKNKKQNYQNVKAHWNDVFNRPATYDEKIIDEIEQHPIQDSLGKTPDEKEIKSVIKKMKSDKAPGASQLTTDMLKNLPKDALEFVVETVQEFWHQDTDFTAWHETKLNILYKGKGDPEDLNNYRGNCLKESCAKIVSSIVSNRLLNHLKNFGSKTQFGMVGCQEAQHTLKKSLLLRRQHGVETYALFVDLVKAFDTVQHPLLFEILKRYGVPNSLVKVIEKMYR
jgi:hypothetical protein